MLEQPNRIVQDALAGATAAHWRKRADRLDAARPKPGDYFGKRWGRLDHIPDDPHILELDRRLATLAEVYRMRAYVCDVNEISPTLVDEIARHLGAEAAA
ncbi:hypothetical protein [Aeromicrobium sp. CnD17-E]|uniref:hypothetical protein n=1 Tax=Aeromicrobium sp. CnD17-E TaxID=2954487 RepID=UPI002096975D|nr:hypothetical protein [Aeromicrobium sp. CnD17-E]MCO7238410.1 hypothetical protein [Aeromicrobium sp. CnD17-E]